jgi:hypothetical protein
VTAIVAVLLLLMVGLTLYMTCIIYVWVLCQLSGLTREAVLHKYSDRGGGDAAVQTLLRNTIPCMSRWCGGCFTAEGLQWCFILHRTCCQASL